MGATPVLIPNTMVKTQAADGTALETVWESRWLPNLKKEKKRKLFYIDTDQGVRASLVNPTSREVLLRITGFTSDYRIEGIQFYND